MPEIPEPAKKRWVCCCEYDPPSLRCGNCARHNHEDCLSPMPVVRRG